MLYVVWSKEKKKKKKIDKTYTIPFQFMCSDNLYSGDLNNWSFDYLVPFYK